ncbi:hypothetical protein Bhyg_12151, partial [Pseudolycoriella hygida]
MARSEAIADVLEIGIDVYETENRKVINFQCQVTPTFISSTDFRSDEDSDFCDLCDPDDKDVPWNEHEDHLTEETQSIDETDSEVELSRDLHGLSSISGTINIKTHSHLDIDLNEKSPYCVVRNDSGKEKVVRKSSIYWLLSKDKHMLSSDRLTRVKQCESATTKKNVSPSLIGVTSKNCLMVTDCVNVGDWCLLKKGKRILVGLVLGFCYLNGTTQRTKEYSRRYAFISNPNSFEQKSTSNPQTNPIGVLCTFFNYAAYGISNGTLVEENSGYLNLNNYLATILAPTYDSNLLQLSAVLTKRIESFEVEIMSREKSVPKENLVRRREVSQMEEPAY